MPTDTAPLTAITHDHDGEPCDLPADFEVEEAHTCGHGFRAHEVYL